MISNAVVNSQSDPRNTHTIQEFISTKGKSNVEVLGYSDLSYLYNMDGIEYVVRNIVDDYIDELNSLCYDLQLDDWAVTEYRYNPKKLSDKLYNTTRLWYMILKVNGLANVHEFDLKNHKVTIIPVGTIKVFLGKIYSTEYTNIQIYKNAHIETSFPQEEEVYRPNIESSQKFYYL